MGWLVFVMYCFSILVLVYAWIMFRGAYEAAERAIKVHKQIDVSRERLIERLEEYGKILDTVVISLGNHNTMDLKSAVDDLLRLREHCKNDGFST